jgi:murein DD-endopeptidase MepM/ murein hydrolase activator NlpD
LKPALFRIALYSLIALALAGAIRFTPRLSEEAHRPADVFTTQAAMPSWRLRFDTLGRGESLQSLFHRGGLSDADADLAMRAAASASLNVRRIPAGMLVTLRTRAADSIPSEISLQLSLDRVLHLSRSGNGWTGAEERVRWTTDTIIVAGRIESNLYDAMDESARRDLPAAARQQLAWSLADVYEYRVDMSRDLQVGDNFGVVAEREVSPTGAVRIGQLIAATFTLSGSVIKAVRFAHDSSNGEFFDQSGKSMRAAFLRAPLEFRRISSVFGGREHPILGGWREHKGTDYAANAGTPVRAIGSGVVIREGWGNGYGNVLEIRHPNGFVTRYGHLSRFAAGVRAGSRVTIGQTVAFVGSTGLATGPHLHFEVLVAGRQRDPRVALKSVGGAPVPAADRDEFEQARDRILSYLDSAAPGVAKLALR